MRVDKGKRIDCEEGISVIIGTLMLILITVTAAAGLAIMVSELQKDEMARQSHQAAVKNEELQIRQIQPAYNATTGYLENLTLSILNLNTAGSRVQLIGMNNGSQDFYPANFTSGQVFYNNTNARLDIPAAKESVIILNTSENFTYTPLIRDGDPLRIWVITSNYNIFEATFKAPSAGMTFRIENEDIGAADRDVIMFDGSLSIDDGSIREWNWFIEDASLTLPEPGNWTDTSSLRYPNVPPGKTTRFLPDSPGPFRIRLSVVDDSGMKDTCDPVTIPRNVRFFPATYLFASSSWNAGINQTQITVTVKDLSNNPVKDATVSFTKLYDVYGNLTLDRWSGISDASGILLTNVTEGKGTVRVLSGKIAPFDVPVT